MIEGVEELWTWLGERETLLAWIGSLSVATLLISFIGVPIVIRRMPYDYFLENSVRADAVRENNPALRIFFLFLKNLVGGILFLGGLIMLIAPGQGVLTMLIGLLLMDFPGKINLEIRLVRLKPVKRAIDWIRQKAEKRPLELPQN